MVKKIEQGRVYIKYSRPFKDEDDEPPIDEVWSDGRKPPKKLADARTLFVYDCTAANKLINAREWDGYE